MQLKSLTQQAIQVLKLNHYKHFTKPSLKLYPHQWNWDSAFIAIGLSYFDEQRAQEEIISLLKGQWANGMIPHIVYSDSSGEYFPDANFWESEKNSDSPQYRLTSGITQQPILSFAALRVYQISKDKKKAENFLEKIFSNLFSYHKFLLEERDLTGEGLICTLHPWESGLDNSPRWDNILEKIKLTSPTKIRRVDNKLIDKQYRPTDKDYSIYFHIAKVLKKHNYQYKDYLKLPFVVQDVMFNSLALLSLEALKEISIIIQKDYEEINNWHNKLSNAINSILWSEEHKQFYDFDVISGEVINKLTLANCIPLALNLLDKVQIESIVNLISKNNNFWSDNGFPLSSISLASPEFNPKNYWRGPVWINMNWLIIQGLETQGFNGLAAKLSYETLHLISKNGFYEYFDPFTGKGYGTNNFSWTAALTIDLVKTIQTSDNITHYS